MGRLIRLPTVNQILVIEGEMVMSTEMNKAIVQRYFAEIWNAGNAEAVDALVSADAVGHVPEGTLQGREVLKQRVQVLNSIYSAPVFTVEDTVAEGDKVMARWTFRGQHSGDYMGTPATGREVTLSGMNLFRIRDGQISEIWVNGDDLGELQQLGVVARS
jgi:steroid delta-isomerase-like uncharacterized protein